MKIEINIADTRERIARLRIRVELERLEELVRYGHLGATLHGASNASSYDHDDVMLRLAKLEASVLELEPSDE